MQTIMIKKCDGAGCPVKERCERFSDEKLHYSMFMSSTPYDHYFNRCKYYRPKLTNDTTNNN
jgi:hypothetical protein